MTAPAVNLCIPRRSTLRTSINTRRHPVNRKPGRCAGCGTWIPSNEGCLDVRGIRSTVYC